MWVGERRADGKSISLADRTRNWAFVLEFGVYSILGNERQEAAEPSAGEYARKLAILTADVRSDEEMNKTKKLVACGVAVVAAALVSLFVREDTIGILFSLIVGSGALVLALAWCIHPTCPRWQILASTLIPAALFAGLVCSSLPLRLIFRLQRAEFDRVALQIEMGTPPSTPFWIGPFRIKMVGRRGDSGTPYVATNEEKSEIDGFVKHPKGHGFNLWSCVTLDDKWSCISED